MRHALACFVVGALPFSVISCKSTHHAAAASTRREPLTTGAETAGLGCVDGYAMDNVARDYPGCSYRWQCRMNSIDGETDASWCPIGWTLNRAFLYPDLYYCQYSGEVDTPPETPCVKAGYSMPTTGGMYRTGPDFYWRAKEWVENLPLSVDRLKLQGDDEVRTEFGNGEAKFFAPSFILPNGSITLHGSLDYAKRDAVMERLLQRTDYSGDKLLQRLPKKHVEEAQTRLVCRRTNVAAVCVVPRDEVVEAHMRGFLGKSVICCVPHRLALTDPAK